MPENYIFELMQAHNSIHASVNVVKSVNIIFLQGTDAILKKQID